MPTGFFKRLIVNPSDEMQPPRAGCALVKSLLSGPRRFLPLLSAAINPKMFSCRNITVWYISASLNQERSSREEKIFTATSPPRHLPRHTSPKRPLPMISCRTIVRATVRWTKSGKPTDKKVEEWMPAAAKETPEIPEAEAEPQRT